MEEWGQSQGAGFGHQGQGMDVFEQGGGGGEIGQQRAPQQGFGPLRFQMPGQRFGGPWGWYGGGGGGFE